MTCRIRSWIKMKITLLSISSGLSNEEAPGPGDSLEQMNLDFSEGRSSQDHVLDYFKWHFWKHLWPHSSVATTEFRVLIGIPQVVWFLPPLPVCRLCILPSPWLWWAYPNQVSPFKKGESLETKSEWSEDAAHDLFVGLEGAQQPNYGRNPVKDLWVASRSWRFLWLAASKAMGTLALKLKEVDNLRKLGIELSPVESPDKGAAGRHADIQPCEPWTYDSAKVC